MASQITIDRLLNLVPEYPNQVLEHLSAHRELAGGQDAHGYSLLHAATSYNHAKLLRKLVTDYSVNVNLRDEDGETPLFVAENVPIARILVEELGADLSAKNEEGQTAEEKLEEDEDQPLVAAYLREASGCGSGEGAASVIAQTGGAHDSDAAQAGTLNESSSSGMGHPPPLPAGITDVKIGTMPEPDDAGEVDPEFRRRIEELAARDDFAGEEGQKELRNLIQDAVSGMQGQERNVRRRED